MDTNGRGRRRFGSFEFDFETRKLFRDGQPVRIQPQPLRVLEILLARPGETISRDELRSLVWGETTFIEFDQALNYCIRQVRLALADEASEPSYVETLPKQGYRFIAAVSQPVNGSLSANSAGKEGAAGDLMVAETVDVVGPSPGNIAFQSRNKLVWAIAGIFCAVALVIGVLFLSIGRTGHGSVTYTQLTDFADSAVAPTVSPDGRMLAFIRGSDSFLTADQIYVKIQPNGEPKRLTDDSRLKYNLSFSPDGSQIAYTVLDTPSFSTYTVSVLGGDSHLLLKNAAGLSWLDREQLLFSQVRSGIHLGVVTGTVTRERFREIYFPAHERGMAHYSYASQDRRWAVVVEMKGDGRWGPCKLIALQGDSPPREIGPDGPCTSAGWSPDGSWMYFIAFMQGQSHLWRQRFPDGHPGQVTTGPMEEEGLAVEKSGRSVITSVGVHESTLWIHDGHGDRCLSSEGDVIAYPSPRFSADNKLLYYLLRRQPSGSEAELWRTVVDTGESESVFPDVPMLDYDISPDGKQIVYTRPTPDGTPRLWLARIDRSAPARRIGVPGANQPHFGSNGRIWFRLTEGNVNYLEQTSQDGSGTSKLVPYPITEVLSVSPGRRWVIAVIPFATGHHVGIVAIPTTGGSPRMVCSSYCVPVWSSNGNYVFVPVEAASRTDAGRSLAIPVGPGENLRSFPPEGIAPLSDASVVPGAQLISRAEVVPGNNPNYYAYVNTTVHRNLYRISLP